MPPPFQRIVSNFSAAATTYALATETLSGASLQVSIPDPAEVVHLLGFIVVTTGVGATNFTPRIRRNGVAGTVVGPAPAISTPASSAVVILDAADDVPGDVASMTYVLTGTAAGVQGTGVFAYLLAVVG